MAAQRAKGSDPRNPRVHPSPPVKTGFWELSPARFHWGSRKGSLPLPYVVTAIAGEAVDHLSVQTVTVFLADSPAR